MEAANTPVVPLMQLWYTSTGPLCKGMYKNFGNQALPVIGEVMLQSGVQFGKLMQHSTPAGGMQYVGQSVKMSLSTMGSKVETTEITGDKIRFNVSQCPFGLEGTSRELCEAMMSMDKGVVDTYFGKEAEVKVIKSVAAGDGGC